MLFEVLNKKVFTLDPTTGRANITVSDLNEISDFTLRAAPLTIADPIPAWFEFQVDHTDFSSNTNTESVTLFSLPAAGVIHAVKLKHDVAFSGGNTNSVTLSVGVSGNPTKYLGAENVFDAPSANNISIAANIGTESQDNATNVLVTMVCTGGNCENVNTGSARIWVMASVA